MPACMRSWCAKPLCALTSRARPWPRCSAIDRPPMTLQPGTAGAKSQADLPLDASDVDRLLHWQPEEWPLAAGWRPVVDAFLSSTTGQRLGAFIRERLAAG